MSAFAVDCIPLFYRSEPRDSEWFYAAGKGADASQARDNALRRLGVKATGRDGAATDGALAGWEQDDHGECAGFFYALVRIEQERVRRNRASGAKNPQPSAQSGQVSEIINNIDNRVNNVTLAPPERHYTLVAIFLGFLLACLTFVYRPTSAIAFLYRSAGGRLAPTPAVVTGRWLTTRFKPVARQTQKISADELARLGLPKYFHVHKGEGICRPVPGSAELLLMGIQEQLRSYYAGEWTVTTEGDAVFCVMAKPNYNFVMGMAFFLYGSDTPGNTDCEILYANSSPTLEDSLRAQQEEVLHQGLTWYVQVAAGKMSAANSVVA